MSVRNKRKFNIEYHNLMFACNLLDITNNYDSGRMLLLNEEFDEFECLTIKDSLINSLEFDVWEKVLADKSTSPILDLTQSERNDSINFFPLSNEKRGFLNKLIEYINNSYPLKSI